MLRSDVMSPTIILHIKGLGPFIGVIWVSVLKGYLTRLGVLTAPTFNQMIFVFGKGPTLKTQN